MRNKMLSLLNMPTPEFIRNPTSAAASENMQVCTENEPSLVDHEK